MKKSACLPSIFLVLVLALILILSVPASAVLRSEWISNVGMNSNQIQTDMSEIDEALRGFASAHPEAIVDSFQIVSHQSTGAYDIFILYRE
jgi:hypothetical protein